MSASFEENKSYEAEYAGLDMVGAILEMARVAALKDEIDAKLSEVNKRYDYLRLSLVPTKMDETGVPNIRIEGVGRVSLTGDMYVSIPADSREEAYQYLMDTGHGDIIKPGINPSTLKATIKAMMKKGEEIPEDKFKVTPFTRASITKG